MACGLGLPASECVRKHWCKALDGQQVGAHWRATCPLCWKANFEISIIGVGIAWNCHTDPECDHGDIRLMLAKVLPCYKGGGRTVARSELEKLLGLSGAALRLRVACLAWDCAPDVAAQKLGLPSRTARRAKAARPDLAGNRRSA